MELKNWIQLPKIRKRSRCASEEFESLFVRSIFRMFQTIETVAYTKRSRWICVSMRYRHVFCVCIGTAASMEIGVCVWICLRAHIDVFVQGLTEANRNGQIVSNRKHNKTQLKTYALPAHHTAYGVYYVCALVCEFFSFCCWFDEAHSEGIVSFAKYTVNISTALRL